MSTYHDELVSLRRKCSALTAEVQGLLERLDTANECIALLTAQRDKARDDLSALTAENERLRKDKERLDWLEEEKRSVGPVLRGYHCWYVEGRGITDGGRVYVDLRAAIDAAPKGDKHE